MEYNENNTDLEQFGNNLHGAGWELIEQEEVDILSASKSILIFYKSKRKGGNRGELRVNVEDAFIENDMADL